LVGRDRELAAFEAAFAQVLADQPAVVVVGGEAGIGKTRLVEEATARFAANTTNGTGARVLLGACVELGGEGMPMAPLVDALRILATTLAPAALDEVLGPARRELARLLPELDPDVLNAPAPAPDGAATGRLFELVLGLVRRLTAEQPLVFVIEDLQWADESTRDLVAFLARTMRTGRFMLVLTYRSDEVNRRHPLRPLVAELDRLRWTTTLQLERFSRDEVDVQLRAILSDAPSRDLIADVYERSEGNAFLVEELAAMLESERATLSPSLRDLLMTRVERLPEEAQQIVRIAAAAGRRVDHRLLAEVASVDDAELQLALRQAVEQHVLTIDDAGRGFAFRHALVREVVHDDILPGEMVGIHTSYAEALARNPSYAGTALAAATETAYHWHAAHNVAQALTSSLEAGRQALSAYAFAEAERQLLRALELWPQVSDAAVLTGMDHVDLLTLTVESLAAAAHEQRALALLDDALNELDEQVDAERVALLLVRRADLERWTGRREATSTLLRAVELLPADPPSWARAKALEWLAQSKLLVGEFADGRALAVDAVAAARAVGAKAEEANALISLGFALAYLGVPDDAVEAIQDGIAVARDTDDQRAILRGAINLSDVMTLLGRYEEAAAVASDGIEVASNFGQMSGMGAFLAGNAAEPLIRLGRWDEAEKIIAQAFEVDVSGMSAVSLYQLLAEIAIGRGAWPEAADWLAKAAVFDMEDGWGQFSLPLAYVEAEVARGQGSPDRAVEIATAALAGDAPPDDARYTWPLLWSGLRSVADTKHLPAVARSSEVDVDEATRRFVDLVAHLRADNPSSTALAALCAAEAARVHDEPNVGLWDAAIEASRTARDPALLAYALVRRAEALLADEDRTNAAEAIAEATRVAEGIGAEPVAEAARSLARRARLPAAAEQPGEEDLDPGSLGLTDREIDVLRLVAEGRSNSQIATALFISPKTVSVHVSNILAKLGVSSRGEAAAVAHRRGVFGDQPI
jgi:DNA-binding CsgD family transcriptional regulator